MGNSPAQQRAIEQKESNQKIENLQKIANESRISIEGNKSLPNLISNFAKLLQRPELRHFKEIVGSMNRNWIQISKYLQKLKPYVGDKEVEDMLNIQKDYWLLLLNTKSVMEMITTKCEIQQSNVETLLDVIDESMKANGCLSNDDMLAHSQCMQSLAVWIGVKELDQLFVGWTDMCDK